MPEVKGFEKLLSLTVGKKFSGYREFGTSQFAQTNYGDEDVYLFKGTYREMLLSGIYRRGRSGGKIVWHRDPFYITRNPRTEPQQTWRAVFADAVVAWQNLTEEEKKLYNELAKTKKTSGCSVFLSKYLKSH